MAQRWLWDMYPLHPDAWCERLSDCKDEDERGGRTSQVLSWDTKGGTLNTFRRLLYYPTDEQVAALEAKFPDEKMCFIWRRIESELIQAGYPHMELTQMDAVTLLRLLFEPPSNGRRKTKTLFATPSKSRRSGRPKGTTVSLSIEQKRIIDAHRPGQRHLVTAQKARVFTSDGLPDEELVKRTLKLVSERRRRA